MGSSTDSVDKEHQVTDDDTKELAIETVNATEKYTQADFDRILRKQDRILMPLMWFVYGIQQVDKTGLGTQATFGIITDTHMKGNEYAWLTTIFFIFPGNWVMQRFSVGKTLAITMFCWGTIVFCTARSSTKTNTGTANYGFSAVVALINYGIGRAAQAEPGGLAAWKGMSLFLGAMSILLSIICFFFLGTPREVSWLSAEEKRIQAARVAHNHTGSDAQKRAEWKWSQVPRHSWIPTIPTGGINTFGNLIYVGLGFTALDTLVKGTIPQSVLGVCWFVLAGYVLSKFKHMRSLCSNHKTNLWPKWGAFFITVTGQICGALVWSMLSTNVAGRTKKSVISVVIFTAYCFGNAIGAQVFQAKWAPRYRPSTIIISIMFALEFVLMALWRVYYVTINRRRAAKLDARGVSAEERVRLGSLKGETDVTDLPIVQDFMNLNLRDC
ncbi:MFS general substrate transporter [Mycena leptocephala]|nr:MFS general substrate transporter [Mycena leptocephala]